MRGARNQSSAETARAVGPKLTCIGYITLNSGGPALDIGTETVQKIGMKKSDLEQFTSWLGKRSYKARLKRFGIERLREIARENGKKGGRPKGSGKKQKNGGK